MNGFDNFIYDTSAIEDMQAVQRRRQLMEAMQAQNMQTPIQGNTGLAQALSKLATSWILGRGEKDATEQEKDLNARMQTQTADNLRRYQEDRQVDPMGAAMGAAGSRIPQVAAMGQADLKRLSDQPDMTKIVMDLKDKFTNESIAAWIKTGMQNPGVLKPRKQLETVNNQLVDVDAEGGPVRAGDFRDKYGAPIELGRNQAGQPTIGQASDTGKLNVVLKPDAPAEQITFNAGEQQDKTGWTNAWNQVEAAQQAGQKALQLEQKLDVLEAQKEFLSGQTAPVAVFMGQLAAGVGLPMTKGFEAKLANSETSEQAAIGLWLDMMSALGARNVTESETAKMMQSIPGFVNSPAGRMRMIQELRLTARQVQANAAATVERMERAKTGGLVEFYKGPLMPQLDRSGVPATVAPGGAPQRVRFEDMQ